MEFVILNNSHIFMSIAPDGFNEPLNMFLQHVRLHVRMEVLWTVHHAHVPVIHTGVEIIVQVNVHIN